MEYDRIEWDEDNLDHALRRASRAEIEHAIQNASTAGQHPRFADRIVLHGRTRGGRRLVVIAQRVRDGIRPITAWEDQ